MEEDTLETLAQARRELALHMSQATLLRQERAEIEAKLERLEDYMAEDNMRVANVVKRLHKRGLVDRDGKELDAVERAVSAGDAR